MNATRRSTSSPHLRTLIVGDAPTIDSLVQQLAPHASRVGNLFEAIGEVTLAPVNEPIRTILISSDVIERASVGAVDALRRVEPFARLVLLEQSDVSPQLIEQARRHFDATVSLPIDGASLQDLLSDARIQSSARGTPVQTLTEESPAPIPAHDAPLPNPDEPAAPPAPQLDDDPNEDAAIRREPRPVLEAADPVNIEPPPIDILEQLIAPTAAHAAAQASPGDDLGDTDLVAAMMQNPAGILDTALALIRAKTGWADLDLLARDAPQPPAICVPVTRDGVHFGFLISHQTDAKSLEPWAEWLSRWMTLDRAFHSYRVMAYQDDLTGAWNRRFFDAYLASAIRRAGALRRPVTVLVFDIDNFKLFNDQFGHDAGDTILRETVRLLQSEIRTTDRVCRIGGDEFAVIFTDIEGPRTAGSTPLASIEQIAKRFQDQVCLMRFPKLGLEAPGTLSISGGLAAYPWDGSTPSELLRHADQLSLESKRRGKNLITFGPGARENCGRESSIT